MVITSLEAMLDSTEVHDQRVCVLGVGSYVPFVAAAKAGAEVVVAERIERFGEFAKQIVTRNRVDRKVHVLTGANSYDALPWETCPKSKNAATSADSLLGGGISATSSGQPQAFDKFDSVITEDFSDDLLSDGLVPLAAFSRQVLLKKNGTFYPKRARVFLARSRRYARQRRAGSTRGSSTSSETRTRGTSCTTMRRYC